MKKDKLHVLQVVGTMNRGGAEVMLMDIYRTISEDFHFDFLVNYKTKIGIEKGDFDDEILSLGGTVKYIGTQWDLGPIQYIKQFKSICDEIGIPDVVHIHLNAKSGLIALAAKKAGIKKIIVHSHADLKFRGSFLNTLFSKVELFFQKMLILKYTTDFWGASKEANNSLFSTPISKQTVVINNAVDIEVFQNVSSEQITEFRNSLNIGENTLVLGNVGRIVRHKNVSFIIDILDKLNQKGIDFKFIFAGRIDDKTYMQEINDKIIQYKLIDKIIYLGIRNDIPVVVSSLDIFVAPALKEGFGLVAVEAQATGIPCVLYTGFPSSVDMGLGLVSFISSFDSDKWLNEIIKVKNNKSSDKELISSAIQNKGFDIKKNTEIVEKLYRGANIK
ncbi:MAG: hypothetical protein DRQ78_06270 [Epsilonproteobacteria bacterium]|nr:MAG: hypothetical protein DRQ78_06270 [Campylobacterota bacterium]